MLVGYGKLSLYTKRRRGLSYSADIKIVSGCSKRPSSKAAGESKPEAYPQGYVEDFDELRRKLADFFSILLGLAGGSQSLVDFPEETSLNFRDLLRAHAEDAPPLGQFFKVGFDIESGDV